jgi:biotin-(acetyl-CoA carboxylase) ligase
MTERSARSAGSPEPPIRRLEVGISVEALLQQWARQEAGPAGAAVTLGTEIAARCRGGVEWRAEEAVAVGVLARPTALEPDRVDLGWLAAGLGAAEALDWLRGGAHACRWPDRVEVDGAEVVVTMVSALGPGRVDHIGLVARVAPALAVGRPVEVETALVSALRRVVGTLDRPDHLLDRYRRRCGTLGRVVNARLLPHGSVRGTALAVDERGSLVVESETGLRQSVPVPALDSLT